MMINDEGLKKFGIYHLLRINLVNHNEMSWPDRSLADSLRIDDNDVDVDIDADADKQCDVVPNLISHDPPSTSPQNSESQQQQQQQLHLQHNEVESQNEAQAQGLEEDLTVFKQTLTRQLWGVPSFLAPPPTNSLPSSPSHRHTQSDPPAFTCNQSHPPHRSVSDSEAPEIRTHFSNIEEPSFERVAPETSGTNMNSISFGSESVGNEESEMDEFNFERVVGITDEVLTFAMNIAMHPETWLDFPIDEEDDTDDFDMSDAQQEHALAIEILAPRLAALRIELCPCHMSESYFWKVYFVLLHSRLNKQDAAVLSTPQVMAARAMWMEELQKQMKLQSDRFGRSTSYSRDTVHHEYFSPRLYANAYFGDMPDRPVEADYDNEQHTVESSETHFIDKSVIEESPEIKTEDKNLIYGRSSKFILQDYEDDDDDDEWPEDSCDGITIPMVNTEDISFSDLENDDFVVTPIKSKTESKAQ